MKNQKIIIDIADIDIKTDEEINQLINKTEKVINALTMELKKRQEDLQHGAIENLEQHLERADTSFKSLRDFMMMAVSELKK